MDHVTRFPPAIHLRTICHPFPLLQRKACTLRMPMRAQHAPAQPRTLVATTRNP